jgi:hypothetical protein
MYPKKRAVRTGMNYTEILNWLAQVDWTREAIGCFAIGCGMIGKWQLGSHNKVGWLWGFAGSLGWLLFAVRIESPTGVINNFVYLLLSVRGYMAWEQYRKLLTEKD